MTEILLQKAEESMIFYNNGNRADGNSYNVSEELDKLQKLVEQREEERKKSSFTLICKN